MHTKPKSSKINNNKSTSQHFSKSGNEVWGKIVRKTHNSFSGILLEDHLQHLRIITIWN